VGATKGLGKGQELRPQIGQTIGKERVARPG
jgi:hypothetical protein